MKIAFQGLRELLGKIPEDSGSCSAVVGHCDAGLRMEYLGFGVHIETVVADIEVHRMKEVIIQVHAEPDRQKVRVGWLELALLLVVKQPAVHETHLMTESLLRMAEATVAQQSIGEGRWVVAGKERCLSSRNLLHLLFSHTGN